MSLLMVPAVAGSINMTTYWSPAVNAYGSPNWVAYATNAIAGIKAGGVTTGSDPATYRSINVLQAGDVIVTSFPSWEGQANPADPFNQEVGTRLHLGLLAYGVGGLQFSLSNLSFFMHSSDSADALDFVGTFDSTDVYNANRVGILKGVDGVVGTADDVLITSGSSTQLVDGLAYVGIGNAYWPANPADMAALVGTINTQGLTVTGGYTITDGNGNLLGATSNSIGTPEPGTLGLLLGGGLMILVGKIRRKKHC
jgi:hypothetical protein